jgi:tRNA(fMet)-specific endonuclease VapC
MLSGASIRPFDEQLAWAAGAIAAELRAAGTPIGPVDAMIAATALSLDAPVCTRNVREFARVAELQIVSPAEV